MAEITVGKRLRSSVCDTEVIVVRAPDGPVELTCGGLPMTADSVRAGAPVGGAPAGGAPAGGAAAAGAPAADTGAGTLLGKRYVDEPTGLEVLCTKPGAGGLAVDGRELTIKPPKALPASD